MVTLNNLNKDYCRPIEDGKKIEYAPKSIAPNPRTPTEEEYNAIGFYHNGIQPPSPPEGKVVSSTTYSVVDNEVVATYEYDDAPVRVRTFSKFKLFLELSQLGLWSTIETWLKQQTIRGVNAYDAFTIANDLTDENPLFHAALEELKPLLGVTDDQIAKILAAAEI